MMQITNNLINLDWWSFALFEYFVHPSITTLLCFLSVLVVFGNLLVVSAIWHENQLHSVTNYLIASLAAADCLVGAVVMPSSIISDIIIGSWTFGANWCDLWHSLDVLASTASIMNLCAISYDRYLAITDPISYPTRMTPKIVAFIIVSLWTCSSLISFPAILWWRAVGKGSSVRELPPSTTTTISPNMETSRILNRSISTLDTQSSSPVYRCEFTDDPYYLLFSSSVSFYIPLCVMLYAYYRIYKAAVQQTRFLKHGSKQVMIGRRKKSKRSRHISEHSAYNDSERTGTTSLLYSEGLSNMENYDRQHLVLRAHRGGGCGTVSKAVGHETNSARSPTEQKSSKEPHNESVKSKSKTNIDHELKNDGIAQSFNQMAQSNSSQNNAALQANKQSNKASIRKNRMDLISIRREKLKVECQRFDSKPVHEIKSEESTVEAAQGPTKPLLIKDIQKGDILFEQELLGRPSLVTINSGSTSVDVSIIGTTKFNSRPIMSANEKSKPENTLFKQEHHRKANEFASYQISSDLIDQSRQTLSENNVEIEEDVSDGTAQTESSSSTGSYGTGSIISVKVRSQQPQQNSMHSQFASDFQCSDFNIKQPDNFTLRRASSYKELKRKISTPKLCIEETVTELAPKTYQPSRKRHRASYGDQLTTSNTFDSNSSLKASKTLKIRSLVRITRTHNDKNDTIQCYKGPIKPPPSLLPLMSMNSDTSTDSSVIGTVGSNHQSDPRLVQDKQADNQEKREEKTMSEVHNNRIMTGKNQVAAAQEDNKNKSIDQDSLVDRNSSFKTDLERGKKRTLNNKAQMLYYDSDKLIQSIVDLTDIHYIDCANIKDVKNDEEPVAPASGVLVSNTVRSDLADPAGQVQLAESIKANIPRQHRGMGKKLSKLAKERKAAKTLGIVVGVFILCWLPFFVMNILMALCGTNCIYKPQVIGPVFTWLGWLNSAMNPVIYACWSRDFRRAFRRVLCTWVEFVCPYNEAFLARKLRLKKSVHKEQYLNRTVSSIKGNTSTATTRSGLSIDRRGCNSMNGSVSRSLLSDQ